MNLFSQNSAAREDMGLLAVMDALADEEQVTQRELSRRTGLNLKKVNYCLHKLLEKGHVKFQRAVHNPDKRAYLYILTPAGFKAKSHLTYRFLKYTLDFYNQIEAKLQRCIREMEDADVKRLALCGANDATKVVSELIDSSDIDIVGIYDPACRGDKYNDLVILTSEDLFEVEWDGLLFMALDNIEELEAQLRDLGLPEERIWRLQ